MDLVYAPSVSMRCLLARFSACPPKRHYFRAVPHVAIVGGGPAGFYAATSILLRFPYAHVDVYDKSYLPFGLIRYGVAPDHPEVKNVINQFTATVSKNRERFGYYGGVAVGDGERVSLEALTEAYHVVMLAYGGRERRLQLSGSESRNCFTSGQFVGWYNGAFEHKDLDVDLSCDTALIIGQGNVALDMARMLLLSPEELAKTDITQHSLDRLQSSKIRRVVMVGRRGPMQVAFTIKELREMFVLNNASHRIDLNPFMNSMTDEYITAGPRSRRRLLRLLREQASTAETKERTWELQFMLSPNRVLSNEGTVKGVEFTRNEYRSFEPERALNATVSPTTETVEIDAGLVISSVGYENTSISENLVLKPNMENPDDVVSLSTLPSENPARLYACGWCYGAAHGTLASTQSGTVYVAKHLYGEAERGRVRIDDAEPRPGFDAIRPTLSTELYTTWNDWMVVDAAEVAEGERVGKPREKVVCRERLAEIIGAKY